MNLDGMTIVELKQRENCVVGEAIKGNEVIYARVVQHDLIHAIVSISDYTVVNTQQFLNKSDCDKFWNRLSNKTFPLRHLPESEEDRTEHLKGVDELMSKYSWMQTTQRQPDEEKPSSDSDPYVRIFSYSESDGTFHCESCEDHPLEPVYEIVLTEAEYDSLPNQDRFEMSRRVLTGRIGKAMCESCLDKWKEENI